MHANTPALLRKGITGLFSKENVSEFQKGLATELMSSIGELLGYQESEIDSITALSGSGPAYFFLDGADGRSWIGAWSQQRIE